MNNIEENLLLDKVKEGQYFSDDQIENALVAIGEMSKENKITNLEDFRRESEARFWVTSYKFHLKNNGAAFANSWWTKIKADIKKLRGDEALQSLLEDIQGSENEASR